MKKYNWNYPTTIWVGNNRIEDLAIACKSLGISKPLLVTDNGLAKSEIVLNAVNLLKDNMNPFLISESFIPKFI